MISADPALADSASEVFARVRGYAAEAGEVVVALRTVGGPAAEAKDGPLAVSPTASRSKLASLFDLRRLAARLARERGPFDLVTAQDPFEHGLVAWRIARAVRAPLELQLHTDFAAPGFGDVSRANRFRAALARFLLPRADSVRAVSARAAAGARAAGAVRVSVAPVRADVGELLSLPAPRAWRGEGDFEIVTVSRLAAEKRVGILIDAVAALRASGVPARLTVIGDGPERAALGRRAAALGEAVRFAGRRSSPLASGEFHAYAQASAFEGYGLSLLEAAARGLPIVTADVGLVGDALVDDESCLVARDAASLADALAKIARDAEFATRLGAAARAAAAAESSRAGETVVGAWRAATASLSGPRRGRLFLVTQALDEDDPVLGFFCRWVDALAARSESVVAVCLRRGRYAPPANVRIISLGKGESAALPGILQKLRYAFRFKLAAWRERRRYDSVLVHMNPEYMCLAGLAWRSLGKPAYLWYTHRQVDLKLRLATLFARGAFTASAESFRLATPKVRVMGHGIDGARFSPEGRAAWGEGAVGTAGRVSPTKRVREIVEAALRAGAPKVRVAGGAGAPADEPYLADLQSLAAREPKLEMAGPIAPADVPQFLRSLDVFVNLSETGSLDKAVLEAAAAGCAVVTSNPAFAGAPGAAFVADPTPTAVAAAIAAARANPPSPELRAWVLAEHDFARLMDRLAAALYSEAATR